MSHRCREVGSCDLDVLGYKVGQTDIVVHLGQPQLRQSEIRLPYPVSIPDLPTSGALRLRAPVSYVSLLADALGLILVQIYLFSPISQRESGDSETDQSHNLCRGSYQAD